MTDKNILPEKLATKKDKSITKGEVLELFKYFSHEVVKQVRKLFDKNFKTIHKKLDNIHTETILTRKDALEVQKYLIQKIKAHETIMKEQNERIEDLEKTLWKIN